MTSTAHSLGLWSPPATTLAQVLLIPLLLGILLSLWRTPNLPAPQPITQRELGEKQPLIAQLQGDLLTVIDATTGRETTHLQLPELRATAPAAISAHWYDWPAISLRDDWRRKPSTMSAWMQFQFDDQFVEIAQNTPEGRLHLFVDLQKATYCTYEQTAGASSRGIVFEKVDDAIMVLRTPIDGAYRRMSEALKSGFAEPAQYVQVIDAISLDGAKFLATEEQSRRALSQFGDRLRASEPLRQSVKEPELNLYSLKNTLGRYGFEQQRVEDEATRHTYSADGNWSYVTFDGESRAAYDLKSWYWKVSTWTDTFEQVAWPFKPGEVFHEQENQESDAPAILGIHVAPTGEGLETIERNVLWNLETGHVAELPCYVQNCQRFDRRLLLDLGDAIAWYDLDRDELQYVQGWEWAGWKTTSWPSSLVCLAPLLIAIGWIAAWIVMVKPLRKGDASRQFGALFMLFAAAALSLEKLQGLGMVVTAPIAEWTICAAMALVLLGLVVTATIQRAASWLLLATAWPTTLCLAASLALFGGTEVYNQVGLQPRPGVPNLSPIYASLWSHLTCSADAQANSKSGETKLTPWRRFAEAPSVKFVEEGKPVSARERNEEAIEES